MPYSHSSAFLPVAMLQGCFHFRIMFIMVDAIFDEKLVPKTENHILWPLHKLVSRWVSLENGLEKEKGLASSNTTLSECLVSCQFKAQFRRRASAVPHLNAIRLDCSTAEARL